MSRLTRMVKAPMMDTALGYLYAPLYPLVQRMRLVRRSGRRHDPADILLPDGYVAEVVATGLNAPVHCCFDDEGFCYVSECGHKIESKPRILRVDVYSGDTEVFFDLPEDRWRIEGAFTGACWLGGRLYFANTDAISRLEPDGRIEDIVTGLPWGDHMTNYPVAGPDGKLYWGQGSTTNSGVVGGDNYSYEWLREFPGLHDVPATDVALAGRNYEFADVLGGLGRTVRTGAYVPFGTETAPGQVVPGDTKCSGAILRCNPDGSDLEVVAWGLRNPFGTAFHPDGRLLATNHGIDERSARYVVAARDDLYEIDDGAWYGWPDFSSGIRLDDPSWPAGRGQEPVLADHPDPDPPKPAVTFEPHAAANGLDVSRDPAFGFVGNAFVALYGDVFPVTTRAKTPVGYKVVRVDLQTGTVVDFAVNKLAGPASKLPHRGLERPSHCQFGPDGALYVVDWGQISLAPEVGGIRMPLGTGTLWRIRRTGEQAGERPPTPVEVPMRALAMALAAGGLAAAGSAVLLGRRRRRRK
ncbi:MAG TPA: PQQ-dependent sugar dehydrogenase [Egibacteraceae bacterium]|jgi:glucose/arabinose dehydrogenase|nr:PQQ-dependent sugar dehydrogenase [Egibacteraceae bacterium]